MTLFEAITKYRACSGLQTDDGHIAVPRILTRGRHVNVGAVGILTTDAFERFATLIDDIVRKPPSNLILNFASGSGEHSGLETLVAAIAHARSRCNVLAKIDFACGPALLAALTCELVFAEPTALIGYVGYWFAGVDASAVPSLDAVDHLTALGMTALCPRVAPSTWKRLRHSAVNGEQAEALGIVGGLKHGLLME